MLRTISPAVIGVSREVSSHRLPGGRKTKVWANVSAEDSCAWPEQPSFFQVGCMSSRALARLDIGSNVRLAVLLSTSRLMAMLLS